LLHRKHLLFRVRQALLLSTRSPCPRAQFGAVIFDPKRNVILSEGWNGPPRGAQGHLCGGRTCIRDDLKIPSGTRTEVGCHHAEANAIANCAANGTATRGAWLVVNGWPCLGCAKLIHHSGIERVICVPGTYQGGSDGPDYLRRHGVTVSEIDIKEIQQ
jgi:dCMP deaminase